MFPLVIPALEAIVVGVGSSIGALVADKIASEFDFSDEEHCIDCQVDDVAENSDSFESDFYSNSFLETDSFLDNVSKGLSSRPNIQKNGRKYKTKQFKKRDKELEIEDERIQRKIKDEKIDLDFDDLSKHEKTSVSDKSSFSGRISERNKLVSEQNALIRAQTQALNNSNLLKQREIQQSVENTRSLVNALTQIRVAMTESTEIKRLRLNHEISDSAARAVHEASVLRQQKPISDYYNRKVNSSIDLNPKRAFDAVKNLEGKIKPVDLENLFTLEKYTQLIDLLDIDISDYLGLIDIDLTQAITGVINNYKSSLTNSINKGY